MAKQQIIKLHTRRIQEMTKCDVCPHSINIGGELRCPHSTCWLLNDTDLRKQIYKLLSKCGDKNND